MRHPGEHDARPLSALPVLLLDAQATSSDPARGALVEIGWARWSASDARELSAAEVAAHVVAPPPGAVLPAPVARLTGLRLADWSRGITPAMAWEGLLRTAAEVAPPLVPAVVHFARFEEPFLRALHERHGTGPFPLAFLCTHAIARRLLPELPRRTLRALAGYFGAAVAPRRRSGDHVAATAFVWRRLVALLAEREGVVGLGDLDEWLSRPVRPSPRVFPLPLERRRELPERPGVYRLLRAGGAVVYVGKAASLRQRVSGHFHAHGRQDERALEMLTQVRDVSCSETETALEAALLEADEIKRLAPPFNVALAASGRSVWFVTAELRDPRQGPDPEHPVGPLGSPAPHEALSALQAVLAAPERASLVARSRALGVEPPYAPRPECFSSGLARFVDAHGPMASARRLCQLGARLWGRRHAAAAAGRRTEETAEGGATPGRLAWDAERVARALEETVLRAAHAVRRARWLVRLSESSLAWSEPGSQRIRLLVIQGGAVVVRADLEPGAPVPVPPGRARSPAERRAVFDVATFDRLRVLTTELRRLADEAESVELRLGRHARLSRRRLATVLRWV